MTKLNENLGRLVLVVGIGFIFYGLYRGEVNTVFQKAARICLECIGIG